LSPAGRPTVAPVTFPKEALSPLLAQVSAVIQTFRVQHVPTAHTLPVPQSAVVVQSARPAQGVCPSAQKPVPPEMEAHTHEPPGPQAVKVSHVCPVHEDAAHAPFTHWSEGHWRSHDQLGNRREGKSRGNRFYKVRLSEVISLTDLPHSPQFLGSVLRSTHEGPHWVLPVGH
jgi:hypothetical protein